MCVLACSVQIISRLAIQGPEFTLFSGRHVGVRNHTGYEGSVNLCEIFRRITEGWENAQFQKPGSVSSLSISYNITCTISWLHPLSVFTIIFLLCEDCVTVQAILVPRAHRLAWTSGSGDEK